jgi:TPR repeat protein
MAFNASLRIGVLKSVVYFLVCMCQSALAVDTDDAALAAWRGGDRESAVSYWRQKSASGSAEANLFMGYLHRRGVGVIRDDSSAARHYLAAAVAGSPEAQYEIGLMYEMGIGVERDIGEASRWYGLSSTQLCPDQMSAGGQLGDR